MNWLVLISGLFAFFASVGHLTMGRKLFLQPIMDASFDEIPKKVMQSIFHYMTIFQILSAVALLLIALGYSFDLDSILLVWFIALNYSLFAVSGIIIAMTSGIPGGLTKMFQWIFWIIIAVFAWIGA
ncbi:hypothetical protein ACFLYB_02595 [Chloroflexota bacterium]